MWSIKKHYQPTVRDIWYFPGLVTETPSVLPCNFGPIGLTDIRISPPREGPHLTHLVNVASTHH